MSAVRRSPSASALVLQVGEARYPATDTLEQAGFTVIDAGSGRDALRKARELQPDLVLLHPRMADISSPDLCRRMKDDPQTAAIPILSTQPAADPAPEHGADSYLTLPAGPRQLVAHVQALLRRRQREQASADEETRRQAFLAVLSHELRNPLAPMRSALDLLRLQGHSPLAQEEALAVIERQMGRLVQLLDGLLDISRLEKGRLALQRQRVTLQSVAEAALELSGDTLGSDHRFELALPQTPVWLEADLLRLAQAFANVLHNAAKFTPAGGLLRLSAQVTGDEVEVSVSDSGIGLELEEREHIFDLFGQGRQLGDQPPSGLGVGLSLARQLAELHQGSLTVTSEGRDRGATFSFRLPLAATAGREPAGARPLSGVAQKLRILVVDDSIDGARLLSQLLEQLGHEVRVAHHGAGGLTLAATFVPDLALLDIGLPDMTGYQLAEQLQRLPTLARTRLVALTGYGQARDRERAFAVGFAEHMVKPVDLDQLVALLGAAPHVH